MPPKTKAFKLSKYLSLLQDHLASENGEQAAKLFSINGPHFPSLVLEVSSVNSQDLEQDVYSALDEQWAEICLMHIKVIAQCQLNRIIDAAADQNTLAQTFHQIFTTQTRWCLPIFYAIAKDLRDLSIQADLLLSQQGMKVGRVEEAARTLNRGFSLCITDRSGYEATRKWGTYYITNLLFKTYFQLGSTNLCTNVLRLIAAAPDLPPLERFPIGHQVTHRFYLGLLSFQNEQYKKADVDLSFAFRRCPRDSPKNKILILNYLIPTRLLYGILPSPKLFQRYPSLAALYEGFSNAIQSGDLASFDECLSQSEQLLFQKGTFLTIEKCRLLCVRTLFKKVWLLQNKSPKFQLALFQTALSFCGQPHDVADVECLLANMIDKGLVKGYISHERSFVVLSQKDPFPPLQSFQ
ncbi:uncharacterized protein BJ171DRAFT_503548 [Polychytrium aggregatum]|uniref:uncharacterized protein n=1 Tax=Polychytrium aggregatum TaxID=110093 RepID=UPI0022FDF007|nr:uncharacterized protein BJ171DRAFT_503548 [Polychytrium aggregatum]KAI9204767.1 hypothetical protein BJ171DRAFT_503548 [Polychytrium aggregatum]